MRCSLEQMHFAPRVIESWDGAVDRQPSNVVYMWVRVAGGRAAGKEGGGLAVGKERAAEEVAEA